MDPPPPTSTHGSAGDLDPHGRAALLLVESLIHALVARSVLSVAEAVSIMEIALDAQIAITEDAALGASPMPRAEALLSSLIKSLTIDLPADPQFIPANSDTL
jgi:uncharacterized MnhB-related membrane protein